LGKKKHFSANFSGGLHVGPKCHFEKVRHFWENFRTFSCEKFCTQWPYAESSI